MPETALCRRCMGALIFKVRLHEEGYFYCRYCHQRVDDPIGPETYDDELDRRLAWSIRMARRRVNG